VYKKNIFVIFGKFLLFFLSLSYYFSFLKFLIQLTPAVRVQNFVRITTD